MSAKIIGLLVAWSAEDWIEQCLKQMVEFCDEIFINISAHAPNMKQFEDKTYDIAKAFSKENKKVQMVDVDFDLTYHSVSKATIFNYMLDKSRLCKAGNWIWTFDVDEFYSDTTCTAIKEIIETHGLNFNQVSFNEKYFYIDTKHYMKGNHYRLFKIEDHNIGGDRFIPTQKWAGAEKRILSIPIEFGMFHYSMLMNPWAKMEFWKTEYEGKTQANKVIWLDKIYRNYDLNNEEYWVQQNEGLFGIKSPWFARDFVPKDDGTLFVYNGKHPKFIEETNLLLETDFRKKYGFK